MARVSSRRVVSALLAAGMAALVSTACGSVGLLGEEPAEAVPPRPAGEAQVITVEVGPKDGRLDAAVRTKRPGEELDAKDARPDPERVPTPRTSDTAGTIPTWENWPAPVLAPPGAGAADQAAGPAAAGTDANKSAAAAAPSPAAKPVGVARPANARPPGPPVQPAGEPASRKLTE